MTDRLRPERQNASASRQSLLSKADIANWLSLMRTNRCTSLNYDLREAAALYEWCLREQRVRATSIAQLFRMAAHAVLEEYASTLTSFAQLPLSVEGAAERLPQGWMQRTKQGRGNSRLAKALLEEEERIKQADGLAKNAEEAARYHLILQKATEAVEAAASEATASKEDEHE